MYRQKGVLRSALALTGSLRRRFGGFWFWDLLLPDRLAVLGQVINPSTCSVLGNNPGTYLGVLSEYAYHPLERLLANSPPTDHI